AAQAPGPQPHGVGGAGRHRGDADPYERRERQEAATAGDGIDEPAGGGHGQHDGVLPRRDGGEHGLTLRPPADLYRTFASATSMLEPPKGRLEGRPGEPALTGGTTPMAETPPTMWSDTTLPPQTPGNDAPPPAGSPGRPAEPNDPRGPGDPGPAFSWGPPVAPPAAPPTGEGFPPPYAPPPPPPPPPPCWPPRGAPHAGAAPPGPSWRHTGGCSRRCGWTINAGSCRWPWVRQ